MSLSRSRNSHKGATHAVWPSASRCEEDVRNRGPIAGCDRPDSDNRHHSNDAPRDDATAVRPRQAAGESGCQATERGRGRRPPALEFMQQVVLTTIGGGGSGGGGMMEQKLPHMLAPCRVEHTVDKCMHVIFADRRRSREPTWTLIDMVRQSPQSGDHCPRPTPARQNDHIA